MTGESKIAGPLLAERSAGEDGRDSSDRPAAMPAPGLWDRHSIPIVGELAALRHFLITKGTHLRWRVRLEPDLVVEIGPNPAPLFVCRAAIGPEVGLVTFRNWTKSREAWRVEFEIVGTADGWAFKANRVRTPRTNFSPYTPVLERVIRAFSRFTAFSSDMMLTDSCVICGHPLIDPISRANMIGPDCAKRNGHTISSIVHVGEMAVIEELARREAANRRLNDKMAFAARVQGLSRRESEVLQAGVSGYILANRDAVIAEIRQHLAQHPEVSEQEAKEFVIERITVAQMDLLAGDRG